MFNVLTYSGLSPLTYSMTAICQSGDGDVLNSPLYKWLLNGKLAENPVVMPSNTKQVIRPTAVSRYLQTVTVKAQAPLYFTQDVAVGATALIPVADSATAVSDTPATATATVSNNVVTVTGVAAGTTVVRVLDSTGTIVGIIVVTVA